MLDPRVGDQATRHIANIAHAASALEPEFWPYEQPAAAVAILTAVQVFSHFAAANGTLTTEEAELYNLMMQCDQTHDQVLTMVKNQISDSPDFLTTAPPVLIQAIQFDKASGTSLAAIIASALTSVARVTVLCDFSRETKDMLDGYQSALKNYLASNGVPTEIQT